MAEPNKDGIGDIGRKILRIGITPFGMADIAPLRFDPKCHYNLSFADCDRKDYLTCCRDVRAKPTVNSGAGVRQAGRRCR